MGAVSRLVGKFYGLISFAKSWGVYEGVIRNAWGWWEVVAHRLRAEAQVLGNLRVGVVLGDQAEDFTLALGQFGECLRELRLLAGGQCGTCCARHAPRFTRHALRAA